jgi:hypothetical protein
VDDNQLTRALVEIGRDRFRPSDELVRRTKQRVRGIGLIPVMVFLSIVLHLLMAVGVVAAVLGPEATWARSALALAVACLLSGTSLLPVVVAREWVAAFCKQLDQVVSVS